MKRELLANLHAKIDAQITIYPCKPRNTMAFATCAL